MHAYTDLKAERLVLYTSKYRNEARQELADLIADYLCISGSHICLFYFGLCCFGLVCFVCFVWFVFLFVFLFNVFIIYSQEEKLTLHRY